MALLQIPAWKHMKSKNILALIFIANAAAVAFEGYAQGVIGIVNSAPDYLNIVGISINNSGTADRVLAQGGITSIYYAGTVVGCALAGWLSDKMGRIFALQVGAVWCMLGIALEASAQNQGWILAARVIAGVGVAHMDCVAPTWVGEVSEAAQRGKLFTLVYLSNYCSIALTYWIGFGLSFIDGRAEESLEVLAHVRADGDKSDKAVVQDFFALIVGSKSGKKHFPRRAQLALWLPLFTQIGTGIAATTIYAPSLIQQAGWNAQKADWLSALNNTVGILGTIIAMYTTDPVGRRPTLLWSSLAQSACMWIIGAMSILTTSRPESATQYGAASVAFIYVFTLIYASTFLIINFNYPSEIFPTEVRSRGMAFGITGWAIGLGAGTLYNPVMFASIGGYGFFVYAGLNLLWFVLIYFFLPETSRRSLEAIERLFETRSPFVKDMERHFTATEHLGLATSDEHIEQESVQEKEDLAAHADV
ncbi:MFS sugar transporter like protein [Zymoseptoria brevis]|uniref:MFS sugar transporter like protein n=1 Tax=Zymoseptoria brevis TaxID=1047168 RepID=A0A0F4GZU0_9PEZI|nr:MFS sugar transporter like protein [Zymoseptoria brevis]